MDVLSGAQIDLCLANADRGPGLQICMWAFMPLAFYYLYVDVRVAWIEAESADSHRMKVWKINNFAVALQRCVIEFLLTPYAIVFLEDKLKWLKLLNTFTVKIIKKLSRS